jgi:hypothetical protein
LALLAAVSAVAPDETSCYFMVPSADGGVQMCNW